MSDNLIEEEIERFIKEKGKEMLPFLIANLFMSGMSSPNVIPQPPITINIFGSKKIEFDKENDNVESID